MPDEIRVVFRRFFALDDHYFDGSGELNLHFSVNGVAVGEAARVFVVGHRRYIDLDGGWSIVVNVSGLTEVRVRMEMRDADPGVRTDFGSITHILRGPWLPRDYNNQNRHFSVEWGVEMPSGNQWVPEGDNEIFACREHEGSVTYTTVDGRIREARMEIHPVRPTPLPPPDSNLPVRPVSPYLLNFDPGEYLGHERIEIEPTNALNTLPNPPVIPILARPTSSTAALIEFTYYFPTTLRFQDSLLGDPRMDSARDPRLEWSAVPLNGGEVGFLGNQGNRGLRVLVYGRTEGEVRLEVRLRGALVATYRALVRPVRRILCRFNILNGPDIESLPNSTAQNILEHLAIANRYLRPVGLELVLDTDPQTQDQASVVMAGGNPIPGIFNISVPAGLTRNVRDPSSQSNRAVMLNYRPGVVNFNYIRSSHRRPNGRAQYGGVAIYWPHHPLGLWIGDNGTPSTSWIKPTGVPPDDAAGTVRMRLLRGNPHTDHPDLFGVLVTDDNGHPGERREYYATVLVHELGHILGLGHRNPRNSQENSNYNDRVLFPPLENLMSWSLSERSQSFDIIQAKAMLSSRVVVDHSVIAP